jgi:hypothetical protein
VRGSQNATIANAQLGKLREELNEAFRAYNETVGGAAGFRDAIVAQAEKNFSNKSEKWQEGDRGSKVQEWISSWNDLDLDELEAPEIEEIEVPGPAGACTPAGRGSNAATKANHTDLGNVT